MILKALAFKKFEFDKDSSLFQQERMNYQLNELKICCCSYDFRVYYK